VSQISCAPCSTQDNTEELTRPILDKRRTHNTAMQSIAFMQVIQRPEHNNGIREHVLKLR
jgi:hypothetical protein